MAKDFVSFERWVRRQLLPGTALEPTYLDVGVRMLGEIADASDNELVRRARAAAFGGLVKRWRHDLVVELTDIGVEDGMASRGLVRSWQQRVFGRSVASGALARYAVPEHSGGGRAGGFVVRLEFERAAREAFERHKDALRKAATAARKA